MNHIKIPPKPLFDHSRFRGTNILVVDDDPRVLHTVEDYLGDKGYVCYRAMDTKEALMRFKEANPSLVILDLGLPDWSALEILGAMGSTQPEVGVILTSGWPTEALASGLLGNGAAYEFMSKPLDLSRLDELVWFHMTLTGLDQDEESEEWPERRDSRRFPVSIPCRVSWDGRLFNGRIRNISSGGAFVTEVGVVPPEGSPVFVLFESQNKEIQLEGTVSSEVIHGFKEVLEKDEIGYLGVQFQGTRKKLAPLLAPLIGAGKNRCTE